MDHNTVMKLKTLNECKKMSFKSLQKYIEKYREWDMAYAEGLVIIYDKKENSLV